MPAATASTAAPGMPNMSLVARISSASETITPVKPSSPRSSPVIAAADTVAGRSPVSSGTRRWLGMMPMLPALIAASNGGRSTSRSSARPPSMVAMASWLSVPVRPWPGKCLVHAATPALCSPVTAAPVCRATRAVSAPKERVPTAGLSAAPSTSAHGARLKLIPSAARSRPIAR